MSIQKTHKKIKYIHVFLVVLLVTLGIMAAFVLGRLSALQNAPKTTFSIQKAACPIPDSITTHLLDTEPSAAYHEPAEDANTAGQGSFVASKNGSKFYPADCSYADRIADANRVWFDTQDDAVAAGYEASTQCL